MCTFPLCVPFYYFSIFKCSLSYQPLFEVILLHLFVHWFFCFGMCSDIVLRWLGCNGVNFPFLSFLFIYFLLWLISLKPFQSKYNLMVKWEKYAHFLVEDVDHIVGRNCKQSHLLTLVFNDCFVLKF
jgi:hypothetical protein